MWLEVVHSNNDPYTVAHHYLDCVRYSFYFYLVTDFVFLLFIFVNCQVCNCKNTCSRKQSKRSAGCSCINVNEVYVLSSNESVEHVASAVLPSCNVGKENKKISSCKMHSDSLPVPSTGIANIS